MRVVRHEHPSHDARVQQLSATSHKPRYSAGGSELGESRPTAIHDAGDEVGRTRHGVTMASQGAVALLSQVQCVGAECSLFHTPRLPLKPTDNQRKKCAKLLKNATISLGMDK
jgi:hypothetical protein